jgi:hypothetical protein
MSAAEIRRYVAITNQLGAELVVLRLLPHLGSNSRRSSGASTFGSQGAVWRFWLPGQP